MLCPQPRTLPTENVCSVYMHRGLGSATSIHSQVRARAVSSMPRPARLSLRARAVHQFAPPFLSSSTLLARCPTCRSLTFSSLSTLLLALSTLLLAVPPSLAGACRGAIHCTASSLFVARLSERVSLALLTNLVRKTLLRIWLQSHPLVSGLMV